MAVQHDGAGKMMDFSSACGRNGFLALERRNLNLFFNLCKLTILKILMHLKDLFVNEK